MALDGLTDQLLTDGIAPGGVDVVDARSADSFQQFSGSSGVDPLDGDASKAQPGDLQAGFSQCNILHILSSPPAYFTDGKP